MQFASLPKLECIENVKCGSEPLIAKSTLNYIMSMLQKSRPDPFAKQFIL